MEDSAPQSEPTPLPSAAAPRKRRIHKTLVISLSIAAAIFGLTEYVAAAFLARTPYVLKLPISIAALLGLTAILLIGGAIVHFLQQWKLQVRALRKAIEETQAGERPIEELNGQFGGLSPLTPAIQAVFRELRQQRAEIARMNLEMRQRVAQRTDALQRLVGKLRAQATRDVLTGLYNRRMLDECLDELVQRCVADHTPLCLLMIDIDDFKLLNDTLGHSAGDTLLRETGQLIRSSIRQQDLAFRCGGDEFVIVLPQATRTEGENLARRLIELIDALTRTLAVERRPRLSIGVSTAGELNAGTTGGELLEDADRRLYAAKFARKTPPRANNPWDRAA